MKKFIISLGAVLALSACGTAEEADPVEEETPIEEVEEAPVEEVDETAAGNVDVTAAEAVYQQSCISCHGQNLEGAMGPQLTGTGKSSDEILDIINNGQGTMPAINLPADEAENLAQWIAAQ